MFGEVVEGVRILGGAAYTIGVLTKTANGQLDGKTAYGTPKWQVNLGGEWDTPFIPGLTLEGRVVYTSAQFVNSANTQKIPEWARLDAGLRYSTQLFDKKVTFRANANNLLDHNYWAGSYFADGIVILSSPRTVLVSATSTFEEREMSAAHHPLHRLSLLVVAGAACLYLASPRQALLRVRWRKAGLFAAAFSPRRVDGLEDSSASPSTAFFTTLAALMPLLIALPSLVALKGRK